MRLLRVWRLPLLEYPILQMFPSMVTERRLICDLLSRFGREGSWSTEYKKFKKDVVSFRGCTETHAEVTPPVCAYPAVIFLFFFPA